MLMTYTLYLQGAAEGPDSFEPFMARSGGEAMERARTLLEERPECNAVEVFFGETQLFRVQRSG